MNRITKTYSKLDIAKHANKYDFFCREEDVRKLECANKQLKQQIEDLKAKSGWISVEDRPKPFNEYILVGLEVFNRSRKESRFEQRVAMFDTDSLDILDIDGQIWSAWDWDDYTHWQPLPDAPKQP